MFRKKKCFLFEIRNKKREKEKRKMFRFFNLKFDHLKNQNNKNSFKKPSFITTKKN